MNDLQKKIRLSHLQAKIIRINRLSGTDCKALLIAKLQEKFQATKSVITVEGRIRMERNHKLALEIRNHKVLQANNEEVVRREERRLKAVIEKDAEEKAMIKAMEETEKLIEDQFRQEDIKREQRQREFEEQWRKSMEDEDEGIQNRINHIMLPKETGEKLVQKNKIHKETDQDEQVGKTDSEMMNEKQKENATTRSMEEGEII